MSQSFEFEVNGKKHSSQRDPETPLLEVLRDELGLSGSKYGCGEGQCGACTVLLNGAARRACITALGAAAGKRITTIEGLESDGKLHPVQQAFLDEGAFQCAYCTPGMIMSSVGLLERNKTPSRAEIIEGLEGNICRCGTYPRVVQAVERAAKQMQGGGR
jgi:aerobic-type carbon monoxide dehydrogenase small subunit (CoxS/CutS family)